MIKTGDKVIHPKMSNWGLGKILEIKADGKARVFFLHAGEKLLGLKHVDLERVEGTEAENFILDSPTLDERLKDKKFKSLPETLTDFKKLFPDGFDDENYLEEERTYKVVAHRLLTELLSKADYLAMLENGNYDEIVKRAMQVVNKTNLIFPNEKMALKDGLKNEDCKKKFSEMLFSLLHGDGELKVRFEEFAICLEEINAAKWTTLTYFLFLAYPDEHMFLKPTVAQNAANLVKAELNYRSELNWLTYKCLLKFSEELKSYLVAEGMSPRDMIDVQSFMWCIAPNNYSN